MSKTKSSSKYISISLRHTAPNTEYQCDQTKPQCQNCSKRGTQCEGYARYPTILQYTNTGLKKRQRFEEVKTAPSSDNTALVLTRDPTAGPSQSGALLTQLSLNRLIFDQVSSSCISTYLQTSSSSGAVHELKTNWMWTAIDLQDRGQAFEASFAALCFGRVGLVNEDDALLAKAHGQYAIGLNALQHALQKPGLAFQDRTLAAIRTLSIYELWSMPWTSISKAYVHEEGMTQWCVAAGPQSINTEFALQVFHDVRWCIMNRAIDSRQRSLLGTEEWKTLPWRFFLKDSLQSLFDLGFELAALLERLDVCESPQLPEVSVSKRAQLSLSCSRVQDNLDDWYRTFWSIRDPSPLTQTGDELSPGSSPSTTHPEFESLWEATNIAYFWLFKMILNKILSATAPQEQQDDLIFSSLELAVNIVSASSYFLADATGWLGPQRLFFPLRRAMVLLISKQSPFAEDAQQAFGRLVGKLRSGCKS